MKFIGNGHVRITGARMTKPIEAPSVRKAAQMAQEWALDNDLVYDGVETLEEHEQRLSAKTRPQGRSMRELNAIVASEDRRRTQLLAAFGELTEAEQIALVDHAVSLVGKAGL